MTTTTTPLERIVMEREGEFMNRSITEYPAYLRTEALWVRDLEPDPELSDDDAARLLLALTSIEVRDVLWNRLTVENSADWGLFLVILVARAPKRLKVAPLALLAFAAWLGTAVDVTGSAVKLAAEATMAALTLDPRYRMAQLVAQAVGGRMDPRTWEPSPMDELPLIGTPKK